MRSPESPPARRRVGRLLWRICCIVLLGYLALIVTVYFAQTYLLFPAHASQGKPDSFVRAPERGTELLHLSTPAGTPVVALFGPAVQPNGAPDPDAAERPTLIYTYGNGGSIAWSVGEFDLMRRRLDVNVIMPDYPGYGMSGGAPTEAGCYAAADACYDALLHRPLLDDVDVDPHQLFAAGWSLGGAVAIDLASRRRLAGLITFDTFTSIPDMALVQFPWFRIKSLVRYHFDNLSKMPNVRCPVMIIHGRLDTRVPVSMSDRLAAAATVPVTRLLIDTADHNTIFVAEPDRLYPAIGRFIADQTRSQTPNPKPEIRKKSQ